MPNKFKISGKFKNLIHQIRPQFSMIMWSWFGMLFMLLMVGGVPAALSASLYLSPGTSSYAVEKNFSVNVYAKSTEQPFNAVSGSISFPNDKLEVVSISKVDSIVSLWAQEPLFSNATGRISFEGIVLNPGYVGSSGKVLGIKFKVKSAGTAAVSFLTGSILANDGQGTNILVGSSGSNFTLSDTIALETLQEFKPTVALGTPTAPKVSSASHPDQTKWFNNINPNFSWSLPADATGVSVAFNQDDISDPGSHSDSLRYYKSYENIKNGVWYFHIKIKNPVGWGLTTHFKVQIDNQVPEITAINFVDGLKTGNLRPNIVVNYTDIISGPVEYFDVKVDDGDWFSANYENQAIKNNQSLTFRLPFQQPGQHLLNIRVTDQAGNHIEKTAKFEILSLDQPSHIISPDQVQIGDQLIVTGSTYPNSKVDFIFTSTYGLGSAIFQDTISDSQGNFSLAWLHTLPLGLYKMSIIITDNQGIKSVPTEPISLKVVGGLFSNWSQNFIGYLTLIMMIILIVMVLYGLTKIKQLQNKLNQKALDQSDTALYQSFKLLHENLKIQLTILNKIRNKGSLLLSNAKIKQEQSESLIEAEKIVDKLKMYKTK